MLEESYKLGGVLPVNEWMKFIWNKVRRDWLRSVHTVIGGSWLASHLCKAGEKALDFSVGARGLGSHRGSPWVEGGGKSSLILFHWFSSEDLPLSSDAVLRSLLHFRWHFKLLQDRKSEKAATALKKCNDGKNKDERKWSEVKWGGMEKVSLGELVVCTNFAMFSHLLIIQSNSDLLSCGWPLQIFLAYLSKIGGGEITSQ